MSENNTGILALENGSIFRGISFGGNCTVLGEAVFNTSMTGYQEVVTDPSYFAQIVAMTAPQIGNYGVNCEDVESDGPKIAGFVVRDLSPMSSNWRSEQSLDSYLKENNIPGLSGIDTRSLTKQLRVNGALNACLSTESISDLEAIEKAKNWCGLVGVDYVKEVTCDKYYSWDKTGIDSEPFMIKGTNLGSANNQNKKRFRIAAYDFGAKYNIFRKLTQHNFEVYVFPANTTAEQVKEINPDGIFLSNGPGDPAAVSYAHKSVKKLMPHFPIFGICLGHQIITHALGAKTFKLKFGHRGSNQPVKNTETGQVSITSQNHGFASTPEELEKCGAIVTEINLNDNTVEGLRHKDLPIFSVQYHPEASPGPHDSDHLFEKFYDLVSSVT